MGPLAEPAHEGPAALQLADLNIAVLYVFAVVSLGVYGVMIGGWASNNKYSLLGALRASSQMISYEIAMGLSIVGVIMISGSLSLREIAAQRLAQLLAGDLGVPGVEDDGKVGGHGCTVDDGDDAPDAD